MLLVLVLGLGSMVQMVVLESLMVPWVLRVLLLLLALPPALVLVLGCGLLLLLLPLLHWQRHPSALVGLLLGWRVSQL
jgi:hypothetical protein